jgi:positive regulator of sigma E activity
MIVGMGAVSQYAVGDVAAAVGALLGFMLGMALVRLHAAYIQNKPAFQATVVAKSPSALINSIAINAAPYSE